MKAYPVIYKSDVGPKAGKFSDLWSDLFILKFWSKDMGEVKKYFFQLFAQQALNIVLLYT
jgi:hypothetical protein